MGWSQRLCGSWRCVSSHVRTTALSHAYCYSLQHAAFKRRMVEHYLDLVARVPVFEIRFRPGLEQLPALADMVEQVAGREA
jgi:hypothetical protein